MGSPQTPNYSCKELAPTALKCADLVDDSCDSFDDYMTISSESEMFEINCMFEVAVLVVGTVS